MEDEPTAALIRQFRAVRSRGYLTRGELQAACYWKSARAIHHIRSNSASRIRAATRRALSTTDERGRLHELMTLRGVSVAMASAILTLVDPRRYGVIDIRVWQLLHAMGAVDRSAAGIGFGFNEWCEFLTILRRLAKTLDVTARDVERTLFRAHQRYQKGRLYSART
jgi:hypothetical protein